MSLLLPDLERQLRAAVRSGRATGKARRHRRLSLGPAVVAASLAATLAIAALIVFEVRPASRNAHGPASGPGSFTTRVTSATPHGTWCNEPLPARDIRRRLAVLARGRNPAWVLSRVRARIPRIRTFTALAFDLGGHVSLACRGGVPNVTRIPGANVFWTLADELPGQPGRSSLRIPGVTAAAIARRRVPGGTLFVAPLPRAMCRAHSLTVILRSLGATQATTFPMPKCLPPRKGAGAAIQGSPGS